MEQQATHAPPCRWRNCLRRRAARGEGLYYSYCQEHKDQLEKMKAAALAANQKLKGK